MCTFLSSLPKHSVSNGTGLKKNLVLSLKECKTKNDWYRLRILNFSAPEKSKRDYPFIERYVHQVWGENDNKKTILKDEIVCPVTRWAEFEGNRYEGCPICKVANQYFLAMKESNYTDKDAAQKNKDLSRKYQAVIPVYVKNDPNYTANNGKFRVIILNDKDDYKRLIDLINTTSAKGLCVFNGKNAVDLCLHIGSVEKINNEGKENEKRWIKKNGIAKMVFSTNPHDIPSITKETVENMGFDENYYVSSTVEELNEFYNKHYKISNDDIPDDDIDSNVFEEDHEPVKPIIKSNKVEPTPVENTNIEPEGLDDLTEDPDNLNIDDLLGETEPDEPVQEEKPEPKKSKPVKESVEEPDGDDFELDDDLLKDLGIE